MATDPLEALRLALMQEVLPVGLALVERTRRGGVREVAEVFTSAGQDPLAALRQEGDAAARDLRDTLDRFQPGLGNPVMKVQVRDIPEAGSAAPAEAMDPATLQVDRQDLHAALVRIRTRLSLLEQRLLPEA